MCYVPSVPNLLCRQTQLHASNASERRVTLVTRLSVPAALQPARVHGRAVYHSGTTHSGQMSIPTAAHLPQQETTPSTGTSTKIVERSSMPFPWSVMLGLLLGSVLRPLLEPHLQPLLCPLRTRLLRASQKVLRSQALREPPRAIPRELLRVLPPLEPVMAM